MARTHRKRISNVNFHEVRHRYDFKTCDDIIGAFCGDMLPWAARGSKASMMMSPSNSGQWHREDTTNRVVRRAVKRGKRNNWRAEIDY